MSFYDFRVALDLYKNDTSFYAKVMACMLKADDGNLTTLRACWPKVWAELIARYHVPGGGLLEGEEGQTELGGDE